MRMPLPNRRACELMNFTHDGIAHTGSVSYMPDGRPCEVFIDAGKVGSAVQHMARDSAVAASLALQHGASLETLRTAMTRTDRGDAAGALGAFLDRVARRP